MAETCWFEYTQMSRHERLAYYAEAYVNAYRGQYARRVDSRAAPYVNPIPGMKNNDIDTLSQSNLRMLTKGSCAADKIGVPYDFYCNTLMSYYAKRGWTFLPKVYHLYSKEGVEYVREQWNTHIRYSVELPSPDQAQDIRFAGYLKEIVSLRERPKFLLSRLLRDGYLTTDAASMLFGGDLVAQAQRVSL